MCVLVAASSKLLQPFTSIARCISPVSTCRLATPFVPVDTPAPTMIHGLVQSALVAASFLASANVAVAQGGGAVNQLQMARLPQPAQRAEFPLVGEESAFKFSFIEDVRAA